MDRVASDSSPIWTKARTRAPLRADPYMGTALQNLSSKEAAIAISSPVATTPWPPIPWSLISSTIDFTFKNGALPREIGG
jgi:hypothetical protein